MLIQYVSGYSTLAKGVLVCLAALYVFWLLIKPILNQRKIAMMLQEIAGSPPKHWFYGHALKFSSTAEGFQWLVDKMVQFPVIMNFWLSPFFSTLQIHHPDSASAFFHSDATKHRFIIDMLKPWLGDALAISTGKKWHQKRRLLTPAFHFNILKEYNVKFNESAKIMLNKWDKKIGKNVEISNDIKLMTFDSILKCAMSLNLNIQELRNHPYLEAISRCQDLFLMRLENPLHHFDWIYNHSKNGKEFKNCVKILHDQSIEIIRDRKLIMEGEGHRKHSLKSSEKNKAFDLLDILMQAEDEDGKRLSEIEIQNEVDSMLFGGFDTTSSAIQWVLHNLAKYPEFQEKCREEINEVVGDKENVKWEDLNRLKYLTMCLKESLRLNPPVVQVIFRNLNEPLNIRSALNKNELTTIPKGSDALVSIYALHRNPYVWDEPEVFDPQRFSNENNSKRSHYAFLPFSAGNRNCIGQNFAMNEMKIVLAQTLRRFKLSIKDDTHESRIARQITLQSVNGVHVYIEHV